jgi:large subunit ribosomal protein L18
VDNRDIVNNQRIRRRFRVRKTIRGTADRPRLCVERTLKHFGCQVINDEAGRTLVSATTRDKDVRGKIKYGGNIAAATQLGKIVAEKALQAGIKQVKFDRGTSQYHGRVAAFADAAREAGLEF